jgi:hypothetical protein
MKSSKTLRGVAITSGVLLAIASMRWPSSASIATILLLYVTFEYLLTTRATLAVTHSQLDLLQRQIQRQERVELHFDLTCADAQLVLRVSNLGLSNFLLQRVDVRRPDDRHFHYDVQEIVQSGNTQIIILASELYEGVAFGTDLEFTLSYVGLDGSGTSDPKCFNVAFGGIGGDTPEHVVDGLDDSMGWLSHCPKCKSPTLLDLRGLKTFDAAFARKSELTADMAASCPDHRSDFLLTDKAIKENQRERENRRKI